MDMNQFPILFAKALQHRESFLEKLHGENTNAYRLFHGVAEGLAGLTIDRYGPLILVQTFREAITEAETVALEREVRNRLNFPLVFAYNHRGKLATDSFDQWHRPSSDALAEQQCLEFGLKLLVRARHQGIDPWLFLDLRAGRRYLRETVQGKSVLNLFSYTGSVGVCAAAAGASEVWNVDFAASSLDVARRNAALNEIPESKFRTIEENCLPVMRQLAGLPVGGRKNQSRHFQKFEPREFDLVFLDPPAWSKGPFGAIDVAGDYPSLFKSAVLAAKPQGGRVIATNHIASIELDTWLDILKRCAQKAGRPIQSLEVLKPESDFPSFDGNHPLKIAVCEF